MNFRGTLAPDVYQTATTLHPYRFRGRANTGEGQIALSSRWTIHLDSTCGELAQLATSDFVALMRDTFGVRMRRARRSGEHTVSVRVNADTNGLGNPESYDVCVRADRVDIVAHDDEAAMRALFHLQWQMLNARGPVLTVGQTRREPKWSVRMTYPTGMDIMDAPGEFLKYPRSYLTNIARYGYNASWLYIDWFNYIAPSVSKDLANPGYARRRDDLRRCVEYFARFGIRMYLHVNMMRMAVGHRFFLKHPSSRGATLWNSDTYCLCSSSKLVQSIQTRAARTLFHDVPGLAGVNLIVGGECFAHCYTRPFRRTPEGTDCPRCAKRKPQRVIADYVNALARGVFEGNADANTNLWQYSAFVWGNQRAQAQLIRNLDKRVTVLETIAKDDFHSVAGTSTYVYDYPISQVGPSARFKALRRAAKSDARRMMAKTETSQTVELFGLPRYPVMHRWAQRGQVLRKANLTGVHSRWRFYGFLPQMTENVIDYYAWEQEPNADQLLQSIAVRDFGPAAASHVMRAWHAFSEGWGKLPFSAGLSGFPYLRGPMYLGPAHPMVFDDQILPGLHAMFYQPDLTAGEGVGEGGVEGVGDLTREPAFFTNLIFTQPFGPTKFGRRWQQVMTYWQTGLDELGCARQTTRGDDRKRLDFEIDLARFLNGYLVTTWNLLDLLTLRSQVTAKSCTLGKLKRVCAQAVRVVRRERDNAHDALTIARRRGGFGYAGAYNISYSFADMIAQKIRHCDEQINHVIPGFYANYAFHMFMTDEPLGEVV